MTDYEKSTRSFTGKKMRKIKIECCKCKTIFFADGVKYYCPKCTEDVEKLSEQTGNKDLLLECQKLGIIYMS